MHSFRLAAMGSLFLVTFADAAVVGQTTPVRDLRGTTEIQLDARIQACLNGDKKVLPDIARIGTPKATAFLTEQLKQAKLADIHTFEMAFEALGEDEVPYLVQLIETESLDAEPFSIVFNVFLSLKDRAESAVDPLIRFIATRQGDPKAIQYAARILGAIGPRAERSVPALLKLAQDDPPSYRNAVDSALFWLRVPEAVPGIIRRLEQTPNLWFLRDISEFGTKARSAGPALIPYLKHDDWHLRIYVARTIGYIGYTEATPDLVNLLHNDDDWRLVYVSAESLGRLRAPEAVKALTQLAEEHWFPPVRDAAEKAVLVIDGVDAYRSDPRFNFAHEFSSYRNVGVRGQKNGSNSPCVAQPEDLSKEQLARLAYKARLSPDLEPNLVPDVGLKVDDGYLVGFDQGEFGGGLVFFDLAGNQSRPLCGNTQGIHRMSSGIVAVTGHGHLGMTEGILFQVSKNSTGGWQATRWKALPGCPEKSGVLPNGSLRVVCSGGTVEVSPSGDIRMAWGN